MNRHSAKPCVHVHGFTLLELLVVILIIGLLTGIVAPRFLSQIGRSETTTAKAQIANFDKALESFRIDMGRYPTESEGLKALVTSPGGDPRWRGPYMKDDIPNDPWGRPYIYKYPGEHGDEPDVISYGADGQPGGDGLNADVVSWK